MTQTDTSSKAKKNAGANNEAPAAAAAASPAPAKRRLGAPKGWAASGDAYLDKVVGFFQFKKGNIFKGVVLAEHPASVKNPTDKNNKMRNVFIVRAEKSSDEYSLDWTSVETTELDERGNKVCDIDPKTGEPVPKKLAVKLAEEAIFFIQAPAKLIPYFLLVNEHQECGLQFEVDSRVVLKNGRKMWTFKDLYSQFPVGASAASAADERREATPSDDDVGDADHG